MPLSVSEPPDRHVKVSASPEAVTESTNSDGLWKLTLDKQPPPGVNLVLFLPVCPTQTSDLTRASGISQTLPVPAMQVQSQVALSPDSSNGQLGVSAAFGVSLSPPLDLVTGIKQECETPLDLSKKCNSSKSASSDIPLLPIKSEPEEFEILGPGSSTEREEVFKTKPGANTEVKELKMDSMDLRTYNTASPGLMVDVKRETNSSFDLRSLTSPKLTEGRLKKEIKMEVDVSQPACAEMEI